MPGNRRTGVIGDGRGRELRFCLFFAVLAVAVFTVLYLAHDVAVVPLNRLIARIAGAAMRALGADAVVTGAVVQARGFAVEIKNNCNAIFELGLYAAAVWAYPASVGTKVAGTLVGAAVERSQHERPPAAVAPPRDGRGPHPDVIARYRTLEPQAQRTQRPPRERRAPGRRAG